MSELPAPVDADPARLSWPVAAGIVGALVLVVLGGGWLLTRAARQTPGGIGPPATTTVSTAPRQLTPTLGVIVRPVPTAEPAPISVRAVTTEPTVRALPVPVAAVSAGTGVQAGTATAAAGPVLSGSLRGFTLIPLATVEPTAAPRGWWDASSDVPEDERAQIERAYARFWEIRSLALLELDADRLTEIMAGAELTLEQQLIKDLRASGRAERVVVEHAERVAWANSDAATVLDEYVSHTVQVDAETKAPLEDPPTAPFRLAYLFRKVDGRWLAVDAVRVADAQ